MTTSVPTGPVRPGRGLPSRHIHLDFHTSPAIPGVGRDFDPGVFAATLADASVASITVFAKCHHGMAYYPTDIGRPHPGLDRDLLGEQISALHDRGIAVAAYFSVMYDQRVWNDHGNWRVLDRTGLPRGLFGPAGPVGGELGKLCLNSPYLDEVTAMAREVVDRYDVDGVFFDNVQYGRGLSDESICWCESCCADRRDAGIDPDDSAGNLRHMADMIDRSLGRMFGSVLETRPDASVFVNGQLVMNSPADYLRRIAPRYHHLEIESLPGGDWGYGHFPVAVRTMRQFGVDLIGMTGAFHRSWGDFGSVRSQAATAFECASMVANGTAVSVGDHLHPHGRLNPLTYQRIGTVFDRIDRLSPWTEGAEPVVDLGILVRPDTIDSAAVRGATNALTQLRHQFDFIDDEAVLDRYRVVVLPDGHRVDDRLARRLTEYVASGGKVLSTGDSVAADSPAELLDMLGITAVETWDHEHQYFEILGDHDTTSNSVDIAYVPGTVPVPADGTTVLARYWAPFFATNDHRHFQVAQVPADRPTTSAAVVATAHTVHIAPPLFRDYATQAYPRHRDVIGQLLTHLLPDPAVRTSGPSTLQATITAQPDRLLVHLLHYVPQARAHQVEVVEDTIPLHDIRVKVRCDVAPVAVLVVPDGIPLEHRCVDGYVEFTVPHIDGHTVIVIERPQT